MKKCTYFISFCLPLLFTQVSAQQPSNQIISDTLISRQEFGLDWNEQLFDNFFLYEDEENSNQIENMEQEMIDLEERKRNPLNLNKATRDQLEQFPFLSAFQTEKIIQYISRQGGMETIYELQLVEGMDYETIHYLLPYVYVGTTESKATIPTLSKMVKYGKHEITTRWDVPLYTREGYRTIDSETLNENPNKRYLGSPWYHSFRYSYQYKETIYTGITAEKDAGEPFFQQHNRKGYDSYSFYFLARDLGKIQALAIGKYRATFGQGLVMGSEYAFGKSFSVARVRNQPAGFKKHSSTDEYNYLRGVGITYAKNEWISFSGFYSHRSLDGIADDSTLTSINSTGKHTLPREVERKNAAVLQTTGGHINYTKDKLKIGLTGVGYFFNKYYDPQYRLYNEYYFRGKKGYNLGVDYKYLFQNLLFTGEIASDHRGNTAIIHSVYYHMNPNYQWMLLYRNYEKKYTAFHARSMAEGGQVQNENGIYLGTEIKPVKYIRWNSYMDYFRFPYLKYLVDEPSRGFDGWTQVIYTPSATFSFQGSYRYKQKGKNFTDPDTKAKSVIYYVTQSVKAQGTYQVHRDCIWKTTLQWRSAGYKGNSASKGLSLSQTLSYKNKVHPLQLDMTYVIFDTDDYESRVYAYEKGMLYSFYNPSYYGKGSRLSLSLRYEFSIRLMVLCKYGQTVYSDRDVIGSGLDEIKGNRKADLNLQLRWKF